MVIFGEERLPRNWEGALQNGKTTPEGRAHVLKRGEDAAWGGVPAPWGRAVAPWGRAVAPREGETAPEGREPSAGGWACRMLRAAGWLRERSGGLRMEQVV